MGVFVAPATGTRRATMEGTHTTFAVEVSNVRFTAFASAGTHVHRLQLTFNHNNQWCTTMAAGAEAEFDDVSVCRHVHVHRSSPCWRPAVDWWLHGGRGLRRTGRVLRLPDATPNITSRAASGCAAAATQHLLLLGRDPSCPMPRLVVRRWGVFFLSAPGCRV